jgi:hypothetical protein
MPSAEQPGDAVNRLFFVAGSSEYPDSAGRLANLDQVPGELALVAGALEATGNGRRACPDALNPSKPEFLGALATAVTQPPRTRDGHETLVVYYSGHGIYDDGRFFLCAHNTATGAGGYESTAISPTDLASVLFRSRGRQVVLVIDACYAGITLDTLSQVEYMFRLAEGTVPGSAWVITAAGRVEQAEQFAFAQAFEEALRRPVPTVRNAPYLEIEAFKRHLNSLVRQQEVRLRALGREDEPCRAFVNPEYDGEALPAPRWVARSMVGRARARQELQEFMATGGDSSGALLAVTGQGGAGKSTLLVNTHLGADQPTALVDARDRSAEELMAAVNKALRLERVPATVTAWLAELRRYTPPVVLLIDHVDYAHEQTADLILGPLAADPGMMRLVLGGRQVGMIPPASRVMDLDQPPYFDADDVTELVARVLSSRGYRVSLPVHRDPRCRAIAERAGRSFLEAHLVARYQPVPSSSAPSGAGDTGDIVSVIVGTCAPNEQAWQLLATLAAAEGLGITAGVWLTVAERAFDLRCSGADLQDLLTHADESVVFEERPGDRGPRWRMHAEALRRQLRADARSVSVNGAYAAVLEEAVQRSADGGPDWTSADEYTRYHLAVHIQRAGRTSEFLDDAGYLLSMDRARLRRALRADATSASDEVGAALDGVNPAAPAPEQRSQLAFHARLYGRDRLAERAQAMPTTWCTRWARLGDFSAAALDRSTGVGLVLAGHYDGTVSLIRQDDGAMQDAALMRLTDAVVGVACGMVNGQLLAAAGGFDGSAISCDLSSGRLYHLRPAGPSILGCAFTPDGLVIMTERGWSLCDPMTGETVRTMDTGVDQFSGWAVGRSRGSSVVATMAEQVALWQLPSGRPLPVRPRLSLGRPPSAVALSDLADELLVGTGDGLIRACDLQTGRLRRLARHTGRVIAITSAGTPGAQHVFTASTDGLIYRTPIAGGRGLAVRLNYGLRALAAETAASVAVVTGPPALALLDLPTRDR